GWPGTYHDRRSPRPANDRALSGLPPPPLGRDWPDAGWSAPMMGCFVSEGRNRSAALARALEASTSRSRGGPFVTRESRSSCAAWATWSTARLKARSFALDGLVKPLNFRTNWREDARISSSVAGGLKLCRVLMFRHMRTPRRHLTFAIRCGQTGADRAPFLGT